MGGITNQIPNNNNDSEDNEDSEDSEEEEGRESLASDISLHHLLHEKSGINFLSLRVDTQVASSSLSAKIAAPVVAW